MGIYRPDIVVETPQRIEPARLEEVPEAISDLVAELAAATAKLESALNPATAASLADMVRIMNTYYSNLIEGHVTRPRDIERAVAFAPAVTDVPQTLDIEKALVGNVDGGERARSLLVEAVAHVRVQERIDRSFARNELPEPASVDFVSYLHREFYRGASEEMLQVRGSSGGFLMEPGQFRALQQHDVSVGRHIPPGSDRVADFMAYFERRYILAGLGMAARILAIPAAHHRFNYIHPFPDGNGRVSRLMSHAMAHMAGIGAHGLWSISRGLARGQESRGDYKLMMDHADTPRQGDLDGRGNLSNSPSGFSRCASIRLLSCRIYFRLGRFPGGYGFT
jgi:Fic family protein